MAKIKVYRGESLLKTGSAPRTKREGQWFSPNKRKAGIYAPKGGSVIKSMKVSVDEAFDAKKRALTYHQSKQSKDMFSSRDHAFKLTPEKKTALKNFRSEIDSHRKDVKAGKPMSSMVMDEGIYRKASKAKIDWVETAKVNPKYVAKAAAKTASKAIAPLAVASGATTLVSTHKKIKNKQGSRYGKGKTLKQIFGGK